MTITPADLDTLAPRLVGIGADVREVYVGDTETTGLDIERDRICSVHFVQLTRDRDDAWRIGREWGALVNPEQPILAEARAVNGFCWTPVGYMSAAKPGERELRDEPLFRDIVLEMQGFIGAAPLVFHNAVYDMAMLDAELGRAGCEPLANEVFCTKKAFCDALGLGRPNHYVPQTNLNRLCGDFGISLASRIGPGGRELHGASVDAQLAARCFIELDRLGWMQAEPAHELPHRRPRCLWGLTG